MKEKQFSQFGMRNLHGSSLLLEHMIAEFFTDPNASSKYMRATQIFQLLGSTDTVSC